MTLRLLILKYANVFLTRSGYVLHVVGKGVSGFWSMIIVPGIRSVAIMQGS